jgi:hypothetical protein
MSGAVNRSQHNSVQLKSILVKRIWNTGLGFAAAYTHLKLVLIGNGYVPVLRHVAVTVGGDYTDRYKRVLLM